MAPHVAHMPAHGPSWHGGGGGGGPPGYMGQQQQPPHAYQQQRPFSYVGPPQQQQFGPQCVAGARSSSHGAPSGGRSELYLQQDPQWRGGPSPSHRY